jgi:hypothetical protein
MQRFATLLTLAALAVPLATAQPSRVNNGQFTDALWARDVGNATITLDGMLSEPEWSSAQSIDLQWGEDPLFPGGRWESQGDNPNLTDPTDPVDATLRVLRKGNVLYVAVEVDDKSIGGTRDFFQHDGIFVSFTDPRRREATFARLDTLSYIDNYGNGSTNFEFIYSWLNSGVGSIPAGQDTVGMAPTVVGGGNLDRGTENERIDSDVLAVSYSVDGVVNDDFNGNATQTDDGGYIMEFSIDVGELGFDMTDSDGAFFPMTMGVYDLDYAFPGDENLRYRTRAWFQTPWGNNFSWGAAYVVGRPDVTVSSGAVPALADPDLVVGRATGITVDGDFTEDVWEEENNPALSLQFGMSEQELDEMPGPLGPYYTHWFRPGPLEERQAVPVVDPSTGDFRFAFDGSTLYVALESDDQAISGNTVSEGRYDGFRLTLRDFSEDPPQATRYDALQYTAVIDSSGAVRLLENAADNPGVQAAAALKGGSIAGDLSDVDEGYRIEMSIDLSEVGYDPQTGLVWMGVNYFDGDDLDPATNSYGTRVWYLTERGGGFSGPAARTYLDPNLIVAGEDGPGEMDGLRALGNAPNPFDATTAVRYELPRASEVTVEVYDVLGRLVRTVEAGLQPAGLQTATVDAAGLSAGAYVYRVRMEDGTAVSGRMLVVR